MTFVVRDYIHSDDEAAKVAAMFTDFDSAWPGGFTRGTADTSERVLERKAQMRRTAILVAEDTETGELIGYCDVDAQPGQSEVAYVELLGARLSVHGRGVGKALLREAVRRVVAAGYREVTLHTWAGNTKAVPLYKKCGFHWMPDSNVFMRNLIPACLAMPLVQRLIGDGDWYAMHEREIEVAPDDITWQGMKVFRYRFRNGDRYVDLIFQRDSARLTAVETPEFSVLCTVPVEEAPAGLSFPIVWEIVSRTGRPLSVTLTADGEPGLEATLHEELLVNETVRIERTLRVLPDAKPRSKGMPAHTVRSFVTINDETFTLETGVKVVRPIEIEYSGQGIFLGRNERVRVRLRSRLEKDTTGHVAFDLHPGLMIAPANQAFTLPARSYTDCEITVRSTTPGVQTARLAFVTEPYLSEPEQTAVHLTGSRQIALRTYSGPGALVSIDSEYDEKAILESPDLRLTAHLRDDEYAIRLPEETGPIGMIASRLGPPFGGSWMRPPLNDARTETGIASESLVISVPSTQTPELTLEQRYAMIGGGVLRADHRVINSADMPVAASVQIHADGFLNRYIVFPGPDGRPIREPKTWGEYPDGETDILRPGEQFAESWVALEGEGLVFGCIWEGRPKFDFAWTAMPRMIFDLGEVPPCGQSVAPAVWVVAAAGDWTLVRKWWKRLVQPSGAVESWKIESERVLVCRTEPEALLLREGEESVTLVLENRRGKPFSGELTIRSVGDMLAPESIQIVNLNRDHPHRIDIDLKARYQNVTSQTYLSLSGGQLSERISIPVIHGGARTTVTANTAEDGRLIIDNGYMTLRLAPGFLGALTALELNGINHLLSPWPETRPFSWSNPWFGGVVPYIGDLGSPDLSRESFVGEQIERVGERGWRWFGMRNSCDLTHRDRRWLRVEIEYLTTEGSNLVAVVTRFINRSGARKDLMGGVGVYAQPGVSGAPTRLHWERNGEERQRRSGDHTADGESGSWAAVQNTESGHTLTLVSSTVGHSARWEDLGRDGQHLYAGGYMVIEPYAVSEHLTWLTIDVGPTGSKDYGACLSKARRLP